MTNQSAGDFDRNVFINCPFDTEYYSLLRPILFTIVYLGFNPQIASASSDSGELRISKICDLIQISKYSIHDLSRLKAEKKNEFYRLNMPFELGIEYGCRHFALDHLKEKKCLILEAERFDYLKAISDLSGVDIKSHGSDPQKAVRAIRNWFIDTVGLQKVDGPSAIWYRFNDFADDFYTKRQQEGFSDEDLNMMPVSEYLDFIKEWMRTNVKH
jgi:hypothetical protein